MVNDEKLHEMSLPHHSHVIELGFPKEPWKQQHRNNRSFINEDRFTLRSIVGSVKTIE